MVHVVRGEHGAPAEHGEHRDQHPGRRDERGRPADRGQRVQRRREPAAQERLGPLGHRAAVPHGVGGTVGDHAEHLVAQILGQRGHREQGEHGRRAHRAAAFRAAGAAFRDVLADFPAHRGGELTLPAAQDLRQRRAGAVAGPRRDQGADGGVEPLPGPRAKPMRLVARHAQRVGQVGAVELVAHAQLDDLPVTRLQPGQRRPRQLAQFGLLQRGAQVGGGVTGFRVGHWLGRLGRTGRRCSLVLAAVTLVPGHRVQPGPEPARVPQPGQPERRDDERVEHRFGRVGRLAQQRPAIHIQRRGVVIVGSGQRCRITRDYSGDHPPIAHVHTVCARPGQVHQNGPAFLLPFGGERGEPGGPHRADRGRLAGHQLDLPGGLVQQQRETAGHRHSGRCAAAASAVGHGWYTTSRRQPGTSVPCLMRSA